jgi:uncharacterized membrane protein
MLLVVGLILGAVAGGLLEGDEGAFVGGFLGALAGLLIGWRLKAAARAALEPLRAELAGVYRALEDIHFRLKRLETAQGLPPSPMEAAPADNQPAPEAAAVNTTLAAGTAHPPEPAAPGTPDALSSAAASAVPAPAPADDAPADTDWRDAPADAAAPTSPSRLWQWLTGGNPLVRTGVVVLFFGVAFLLKYAAEHAVLPIELRVAGVAVLGIGLQLLGWRLRAARPGYALALQGGAVGVLYLTVFAAYRLYHLLPGPLAFVLLAGIAVFSGLLAVRQNAVILAVLGGAGGFLAPLLASTGGGSHVGLFSYYAVLNAGILLVAWHKAWRALNVMGFAFTFIIGLLWGARDYRPELFASTEPFLILFFLFYCAIAVLYAHRQPPALRSPVDGTLVFGVPLVAFGLQTRLVSDIEFGAAYSALALAAFYLLGARWLLARGREPLRLLFEAWLALGVIFATLTLPLALDGRWTSAAWALEAAGILWVGVRQQRRLARAFALLLQLGAGVAFLAAPPAAAGLPVLNSACLGALFVAAGGGFSTWYLHRHRSQTAAWEQTAAGLLFLWTLLWWFGGGLNEIQRHAPPAWDLAASLLFVTASSLAFHASASPLQWPALRRATWLLPPAMLVMALLTAVDGSHPLAHGGWLAWPLAFAVLEWLLRRHDVEADWASANYWHALRLWLFAGLLTWEAGWRMETLARGDWPAAVWGLLPALLLWLLNSPRIANTWPLRAHAGTYLGLGAMPLAAWLMLWLFWTLHRPGDAAPLDWLPLLNPLDIAAMLSLAALWRWQQRLTAWDGSGAAGLQGLRLSLPQRAALLGLLAFLWANAELLRVLHHWADIAYRPQAIISQGTAQAAFSLFWTLTALGLMLLATRHGQRRLWQAGAALMAVVILKLFTADLANIGGAARIVSFMGVGLLMLVIGYFAPLPPKDSAPEQAP